MLVSTIHQYESAIGIHVPLPLWMSLPPHPTSLGCNSIPVWAPWVIQQIPTGYLILHMVMNIFNDALNSFHPLLPPAVATSLFSMSASPLLDCRQVHQYLLSRFCIYTYLFFTFWLTSLCIICCRFIHLIRTESNVLQMFEEKIQMFLQLIFHCGYVP